MKKLILVSVIISLSMVCYPQKGKWKKAQDINTIESYQEFINKYPDSKYLSAAKIQFTKLEFEKSEGINTLNEYKSFLEKYPESNYTEEVNHLIESLIWDNTITANTIESYESYIEQYPEGSYMSEAKSSIEKFIWDETIEINTVEAYENFIERYPESKYNDRVKVEIFNYTKIKENLTLSTGEFVLMSNSLENQSSSFSPSKGNIFLIVALKLSNIKGEYKISKEKISVKDNNGNIFKPGYFELPVNRNIAFTSDPLQLRDEDILIIVFDVVDTNDLILSFGEKEIGAIQGGTVAYHDLNIRPIKNKSRNAMPVKSSLIEFFLEE